MTTSNKSKPASDSMAKKKEKTVRSAGKKKTESPVDMLLADNEHLKTAVQQIEKQFGDGAIMALGNDSQSRIRGISTGSLSLDIALGGQGVPCGRIIEVFGPESSRQDYAGVARDCGGAEKRWYCSLCRC